MWFNPCNFRLLCVDLEKTFKFWMVLLVCNFILRLQFKMIAITSRGGCVYFGYIIWYSGLSPFRIHRMGRLTSTSPCGIHGVVTDDCCGWMIWSDHTHITFVFGVYCVFWELSQSCESCYCEGFTDIVLVTKPTLPLCVMWVVEISSCRQLWLHDRQEQTKVKKKHSRRPWPLTMWSGLLCFAKKMIVLYLSLWSFLVSSNASSI